MTAQLDLPGTSDVERSATISDDGLYRYDLTRTWGPGPRVLWIMLNPSTADGDADDPTIRRIIGFSKRDGFGSAVVCNLFAFRATEPAFMFRAEDPYGPLNDEFIQGHALEAASVVAAWGDRGSHRNRDAQVIELLREAGVRSVYCIGRTTKARAPRHPLYVRKTQPFDVYWRRPTQAEFPVTPKAEVVPIRGGVL